MSRRFTVAALALAVAGGMYLSGGPAEASNMGFKLEKNFESIGPPENTRIFRGFYYVSMPLFSGLADIADSTMTGANGPCTGVGDGVVNADDALCDWWVSRQGTMILQRFNADTCSYEPRTLFFDPLFMEVTAAGSYTAPFLNPGTQIDDDAYWIIVPFEAMTGPVDNQAVIVGSHDPSYAGQTIAIPASDCRPNKPIINVPYHTMYRTVDEILCGLEGPEWIDGNGDGCPDTCPNGIYADRGAGGSGALILVQTFDNVPDGINDNSFITRSLYFDDLFMELTCAGSEFDLAPGEAYEVILDNDGVAPDHTPTVWLSPHF